MSESNSIKDKVLKGGIFLTFRQLLSSGLSVISVLIIARSLGPEKYGLVTTALGIFYFLVWSGQMGLNMYIVRQPNLEDQEVEQLIAFYNTVGIGFCGLMWVSTPAFAWWTGVPEVSSILRWLIPAVWLNMVGGVSLSMLSRNLRFDRVSLVEGLSQISNYLLSVPIVLLTGSYWGPIAGMFLQFLLSAVLAYSSHPIRLTLRWRWLNIERMVTYGVTFFFASWIQTLGSLTIPMLVTPLAGVEAAGIAGVTTRMVQQLSLLRVVIRRMSISVIAKLMENPDVVQRAVSKGMSYMALLMTSVCVTFACVSPWLIPFVFGSEWIQSTKIFPLIAFSASVSAIFDLHLATLHAVGRNNIVTLQNLIRIGLIWIFCWLLIPSLGLWGFAIAEMTCLPSYYLSHRAFVSLYPSPSYRIASLILLAAIPPLLVSLFAPLLISLFVLLINYTALVLISADIRKVLLEILIMVKTKTQKRKLDAV